MAVIKQERVSKEPEKPKVNPNNRQRRNDNRRRGGFNRNNANTTEVKVENTKAPVKEEVKEDVA